MTDRLTFHTHIENKLGAVPDGRVTCHGCGSKYKPFAITKTDEGKWRCGHCQIAVERENVEPYRLTWDDIRGARAVKLAVSDWTQLPDVPEKTREAWKVYRKALRNITLNFDQPENVEWPEPPV